MMMVDYSLVHNIIVSVSFIKATLSQLITSNKFSLNS